MPLVSLQNLATQIGASQARWSPGPSWLDNLTDAQRVALLGVKVNPAEVLSIRQKALAALGTAGRAGRPGSGGGGGGGGVGGGVVSLPPQTDWRVRGGRNCISPVKNQGACGSCVSFCACALVEAMATIERNVVFPDLSEAELHFCSIHGPSCDGWWPSDAFEVLRTRGVITEALFPYVSAFQSGAPSCIVVPNRDALATRITAWQTLYTSAQRKEWLCNTGPLCAVFHLYFDFFNYRAGVYSHVAGAEAGYHCAEVVGYSDPDGCWICKNQWGDTWGEGGFFRIGYGQCGIDDLSTDTDALGNTLNFPAWAVQGVVQP